MKLSVLVPSHRVGLSACSRILAACSFAGNEIEVIVRDNSACPEKRAMLSQIQADNCRIMLVDECGAYENQLALIDSAEGEFVFVAADDDHCSKRSIDAMLASIERWADDESVVGITGLYLCETDSGTLPVRYASVESMSALERFNGYLASGTSLIFYSAMRRTSYSLIFRFVCSLPFRFSYGDQIIVMMAILSGRYIDINRLIYVYDNAGWDGGLNHETDFSYYAAAGIDRSILWVHWLFCGFEGAKLILSNLVGNVMKPEEKMAAANSWYQTMLVRLRASIPHQPRTPHDVLAVQLHNKWLEEREVNLDVLLSDLSEFLAKVIDDEAKAVGFYDYWVRIRPTFG